MAQGEDKLASVEPSAVPAQATADHERLGRIQALDLEPVVYKLVNPDPGLDGMALGSADQAVALYRCFWKLVILEPGTTLVPPRDVDRVWHAHLMDTAKYRADCDWVFGCFLDHFPYAGYRGAEDRIVWLEAFTRTRRLFRERFGTEIGRRLMLGACHAHDDVLAASCLCYARPPVKETRPRPDRSEPGGLR